MSKHFPPTYRLGAFTCPYCSVYASQRWATFLYRQYKNGPSLEQDFMHYASCGHCAKWSYWFQGAMVVPPYAPVPVAHADLPETCRDAYDEARSIVGASPRAASALLRLALQKLMVELGEKGANLNDDIASLVQKGLPVQIQQALDYCRVVGNNAVHPLEIQINDTPEIAHTIFDMLNIIVEDRIAKPKQIAEAYARLPEGAKKAIAKRDAGQGGGQ